MKLRPSTLLLVRLLHDRHPDSTLSRVSRNRVWRGTRCALALILALDEAVCDAEDRVDDDGVDAFCDLVLWDVSLDVEI